MQFAGFPNFFAVLGPHNPAAFCNITRCVENNVDWIVDCLRYLERHGHTSIEARADAEDVWTQRCYDSANRLLFSAVKDSWFFGYHNPGGDQGRYLIFAETAANGYPGFTFR